MARAKVTKNPEAMASGETDADKRQEQQGAFANPTTMHFVRAK